MGEYMLTKEEAELRSRLISNVEYQILLVLSEGDHFLGASTSNFSLSEVQDLWLDYKGNSILALSINGSPQQIEYKSSRILLKSLRKGENSVQVTFESTYSHDGLGLHSLIDPVDNEVYLYSQFEPFAANRVFPCFDQPDLKSTFELSVVAKEAWQVISNTALKSSPTQLAGTGALSEHNLHEEFNKAVLNQAFPYEPLLSVLAQHGFSQYRVHHFQKTVKISTYLAALCAGPYFRAEASYKYPLGFYCRQSMKHLLDVDLYKSWTIAGFEFYEEFFDYPYAFGKYDQIFVPEFNFVAMENIGCVTLDDKFLFENGRTQNKLIRACIIMLHEMSHMWFGDLVTMKWWDDLWLNESFATFISVLCVSRALQSTFPEAWLWFYAKIRCALLLDQQPTTHPIFCNIRNSIEIFTFFDSITYEKGSTVLKQLFYLIGEDRFRSSIQQYFKNNAFGNTTFESLIKEIEKQVSDVNIQDWAEKWIKTAGLNEIVAEVARNDQGHIVSYKIGQRGVVKGLDTVRPHCLTVAILDKDLQVVYSKRLQGEKFEEKVEEAGNVLVLDLGHHAFIKPVVDEVSLSHLLTNLAGIQDSLTRMQIYGMVLDLVKDRKLSIEKFFEFSISNLASESELFNVIFLIKANCEIYKLINFDQSVLQETGQKTVKVLISKKLNADERTVKSINKLLLKSLYHPSDILEAVSWLDTENLSQNVRWGILRKYSALSISAKPLVESELQKSRSHSSILEYSYCSAAYPDESTKSATWELLLTKGQSLPKFERIEIMKGFNQIHQKDLLKPFAYSYFHQILRVIDRSDLNFSEDFLRYLMPTHLDRAELKSHLSVLITELPSTRNDLKVKIELAIDDIDSVLQLTLNSH